jgi:ketosteroid isomerase-like protein
MDARKALLTRFYRALDQRDVEGIAATLHPDADFPDQIDGGRRRGIPDLRGYWTNAFTMIRAVSTPSAFRAVGENAMLATVHHHVSSLAGKLWYEGSVQYRFEFRDGLIVRMDQVDAP